MKSKKHHNFFIIIFVLLYSQITVFAQNYYSTKQFTTATPNDPLLFENNASPYYQYHLNIKNNQFSLDYLATWEFAKGHALIGIMDTELYTQHPDITNNIRTHLSDSSLLNDDPIPFNGIFSDHASWVVGVIAPKTNNSEGLAGVCQDCSLSLQYAGINKEDIFLTVLQNGVQVINMSSGYNEEERNCTTNPSVCNFFENIMVERDIVMVAVSQNRYGVNGPYDVASPLNQNTFPGSHPNIIQVGGLTKSLEFWNDCEGHEGVDTCGSFATPNQELVAPAKNILTAITYTVNGHGSCGIINNPPPLLNYDICSGNSFAAPQVTGLVGILRSTYPQLSAYNIRLLLQKTAQSPYQERHEQWGYGLINPLKSVTAILGKVANIQQINRSIPMFVARSVATSDSIYSSSPQVMAAALAGDLRGFRLDYGFDLDYNILDIGLALPEYRIPASTQLPYAAFHILSTHNNPIQIGKKLIKLFRLSRLETANGQVNLDHAYVTQPYIEEFKLAGYNIDAIEGYIFPPCGINDTNCQPPAHTECLIARNVISTTPDWALILESQLTNNIYQNHTAKLNGEQDICLGYAYKPEDADADGLIDGYEEFLGTNINDSDTDNDGRSDGQELLVPIDGFFSDPYDNKAIFQINPGLTGAWFYPETSGQGLFLDVMPQNQDGVGDMFIGWFTHNLSEQTNNAGFGDINHRWFTAQGEYHDDKADLILYLTDDGVFDSTNTATSIAVGKMKINFTSCTKGVARYSFDNTKVRGAFPISRLSPDQNCENSANSTAPSPASTSGLSGAWFNPATSGQGMFFDVFNQQIFIGWFTYSNIQDTATTDFGSTDHRWFTVQGTLADNNVEIPIFLSKNGIFDTTSSIDTATIGSLKIDFETCTSGTVNYEFSNSNIAGSFPISRITPNVYCQEEAIAKNKIQQ